MLYTNAASLFTNPKHLQHLTQSAIGLDNLFERVFGELSNFNQNQTSSYPPYNLKKDGDDYIIELAVAGLNEEDITVNVENGVLTVESTTEKSDEDFLYQGIAKRSFIRCWTLSDDIIVKGASLDAGMLTIKMEKIIPEEKKAKQIKIVTNQKKLS